MPHLKKPVFLQIKTQSEMDAVINALSSAFDYTTDTHTDEMMHQPVAIHELSQFNDDIIRGKLSEARRNMDEKLNVIIAIRDVQARLDDINSIND